MSARKKFCFGVLVCIAVLALIEVGARVASSGKEDQRRFAQIEQVLIHLGNEPGEILFEPDPVRFWRLRPSLELPQKADKRWSGRIANSLGYRNREFSLKKPAGTFRIVCFGDSTTFGFGVDWDEAWPHLLEKSLNARESGRRVEVINAGVPGYSSYQGLAYMKEALPKLEADLVLATFGNNDGWPWDDHTDREFARRRNGFGVENVIASSRAVQLGRDWYRSRLGEDIAPDARWAERAWYYQAEPDWQPRVPPEEFAANAAAMAALCRSQGAELVLVRWADRIQVLGDVSPRLRYLEAIDGVCAAEGLRKVDLVRPFLAQADETAGMYLPEDNIHVDAAGNAVVEREMEKVVQGLMRGAGVLGN